MRPEDDHGAVRRVVSALLALALLIGAWLSASMEAPADPQRDALENASQLAAVAEAPLLASTRFDAKTMDACLEEL